VSPTRSVPATAQRFDLVHVVVTGSECTGKTTLAMQLAQHYSAERVPEFVRVFAQAVGGTIQFSDHGPIARGQIALEDECAGRASGLIVHDTDLFSTVVYCRHYFGRCPQWIEAAAADRRHDLYLVCGIDAPWVADGMRDRADRRQEMHELFLTELGDAGARWELVSGDEATRLAKATALIDQVWR
jgi:NadR type nicotinamide-nucleotide adenylyltransferase